MGIFAYAPGIRVFIDTRADGIVDVSDDITRGSMMLNENAPHSFNFSIKNYRRQYDGIFTPNDRIHVQMKRINWLPVFSGYLNRVPLYSAHPRDVSLRASCTIKRLQYRLWDPGAQASMDLLLLAEVGSSDGGVKERLIKLLTEVAGWPKDLIHIGEVPGGWNDAISGLYGALSGRINASRISIGTLASFGGTSPTSEGGGAGSGPTSVEGIGPGTGALPYSSGKVSWFGGPNGGAYGKMQLTGESGTSPDDQHYTAMRFPYYDPNTIKPIHSPEQTRAAINWWRNRKILVTNPKNNRSVVLRAADWGPNIRTGKNLDMSRQSLEQTLQGATNDVMNFSFAPLDAPLGLYRNPAVIGTADGGAAQGGAGGGTGTPAAPPSGGSGKIETNGASIDSLSPGGKAMAQVVADRARDGGFRAVVTSTVRSNSTTNHSPGKRTAIDYGLGSGTNGMALFNAMLPYQSQLAELFFTPAGFCVPLNTLILTRRGWLSYDEVVIGDETIGYNPETEVNEWTRINNVLHYSDPQPLVEIKSKGYIFRCTPNHRWLSERRTRVNHERCFVDCGTVEAIDLTSEHRIVASRPAILNNSNSMITPQEAAIIGWLMTDGHVRMMWPSQRIMGAFIYQKKEPQLSNIRELLKDVPHVEGPPKRGCYEFRLDLSYTRALLAKCDHNDLIGFVLSLSDLSRYALFEAMFAAEGTTNKVTGQRVWSQVEGPVLEAFMLVAYLCGERPSRYKTKPREHFQPHQSVALCKPKVGGVGSGLHQRMVDPEPTWCVQTDLGTWTAQQDGVITLTGNSIKNGQRVAPIAASTHRDHVHMASASTQTFDGKAGAPGGAGGGVGGGAGDGATGSGGTPLIERTAWDPSRGDPEAHILADIRALMNDEPILPTVEALIHTSMRSYCSAPNGDFIGWFPDYFGVYGTAGKMVVRNIELQDFTIDWDDAALKTHVFTAGASAGFTVGGQLEAEVTSLRRLSTAGIATVEFREMMEALFNITAGNDPYGFLESATFLNRFGARQKYVPMGNITGEEAEFWYACFLFQRSWSEQFTANIPLTFMPELFPGMLIQLPNNIQAYVQAVTHSFDFSDGMGFDTNVDTAALSSTTGSGIAGLPRGGRRLV